MEGRDFICLPNGVKSANRLKSAIEVGKQSEESVTEISATSEVATDNAIQTTPEEK